MAKFRSTAEMKLKLVLVLTVVAMMAIISLHTNLSNSFFKSKNVETKFGINAEIFQRSKRSSDINSR